MPDLKELPVEGLRRWGSWLEKSFPIACCRREDLEIGSPEIGEAVWQVQIRHGKHARVRVTAQALELGPEEFARAVQRLERRNWYGALDEHLQIRIGGDGTVGAVG